MLRKTILILIPAILLSSCGYSSNSNVQTYEKTLKAAIENPDFHSQLYIFPSNTNNGVPTSFAYKSMGDLLTGSYFLYLVMTYDEENFSNELTRIENVEGHFPDGQIKSIIHFEEQSIYLTINRDNKFEYVKYNRETLEIAYVSNQLFSWATANVELRHKLPNLKIPSELDDGENSYNMYYFYSDEPDGMGGTIHIGMYVID